MKNLLLTLLTLVLLVGFAFAIPSGDISDEYGAGYEDTAVDDEFDFL